MKISVAADAIPPAELRELARVLPAALSKGEGTLRILESQGAFRAELEIRVGGVRVVGRSRAGDARAAAAGAFQEAAERGRTHAARLAALKGRPAPETVEAVRLEGDRAKGDRTLRPVPTATLEQALLERELSGDGAFVYRDAETGVLCVLARSEDGRFERTLLPGTPR